MDTRLDVCPHCRREVLFGERQHHLSEACVPETVVRVPGFAGRMPRVEGIYRGPMEGWSRERTEEVLRRFEETMRRSSRR